MAQGRYLTIDPTKKQIVHLFNRCVRRAFLCGTDALTGKDYSHRKQWMRDRMEFLASIFAIEILTFAILSNHFHLILRTRPDIVKKWTDEEVAWKVMKLAGKKWFGKNGKPRKSAKAEVARMIADEELIKKWRLRLSDVSWVMRYLDQNIARRSNLEDGVTGTFWEARFGSKVISEEPYLLIAMIYVELNLVRAKLAATPEESDFTGIKERIDDWRQFVINNGSQEEEPAMSVHDWERLDNKHSGWLAPIEIDERIDPAGAELDPNGRRAGRQGIFPFSFLKYLEIVEWSGQHLKKGKHGKISKNITPVFERLGFESTGFLQEMNRMADERDLFFKSTERQGIPENILTGV